MPSSNTLSNTCQLKISGNVIDSVTRKAIQQFDLFYGDAKVNEEGNCSPVWSPVVREILHFRNGVFEDTRPQARGESLGCFIKIKADGYAPYVSRMIRTNETDVTLNVELRRVDEKVVQVISPSLQPITRADIGFVTPNSGLEMVPGGFDAVSTLSQINLRRTDPKGLFRLSSDPDITHGESVSGICGEESSIAISPTSENGTAIGFSLERVCLASLESLII